MTNYHHNGHPSNGKTDVRARPPKNEPLRLSDTDWDYLNSLGKTKPERKKKARRARPVDDEEDDDQLASADEDDADRDMQWEPVSIRADQVKQKPLRWLWEGRIACGKICVIAGHPGLGKSQLTIDITARVTARKEWPKADKDRPAVKAKRGEVILMSAEDDPEDTIVPRLKAAGADLGRVHFLKGAKLVGDDEPGGGGIKSITLEHESLKVLQRMLKKIPSCRLIIIDPVSAYCGRVDSHKNAEVREALAELARIANESGVAVILVTHFAKQAGNNQTTLERVSGSHAFGAVARTAWAVMVDRQSDDPERRLFLALKNNLAKKVNGLAFSVVPYEGSSKLRWEDVPIEMTADEAMSAKPRTDIERATSWLQNYLADGKEHDRDKLISAALNAGFAERTIERASHSIFVRKKRKGFPSRSYWSLDNSDPFELVKDQVPSDDEDDE